MLSLRLGRAHLELQQFLALDLRGASAHFEYVVVERLCACYKAILGNQRRKAVAVLQVHSGACINIMQGTGESISDSVIKTS